MNMLDELLHLFEVRGSAQYFGEEVTQMEHALQAATFAERAHCSDAQIAAALLHDVGHLIHDQPENIADEGIDARHEALGEAWLKRHFGAAVTEPVRLHVAAKRYLCATDADYRDGLSAASARSLVLQGGPMSSAEVEDFERNLFFREAVQLRRFDDRAKIVGMETPSLKHFQGVLEACRAVTLN